jgi:hypothetical protein
MRFISLALALLALTFSAGCQGGGLTGDNSPMTRYSHDVNIHFASDSFGSLTRVADTGATDDPAAEAGAAGDVSGGAKHATTHNESDGGSKSVGGIAVVNVYVEHHSETGIDADAAVEKSLRAAVSAAGQSATLTNQQDESNAQDGPAAGDNAAPAPVAPNAG